MHKSAPVKSTTGAIKRRLFLACLQKHLFMALNHKPADKKVYYNQKEHIELRVGPHYGCKRQKAEGHGNNQNHITGPGKRAEHFFYFRMPGMCFRQSGLQHLIVAVSPKKQDGCSHAYKNYPHYNNQK